MAKKDNITHILGWGDFLDLAEQRSRPGEASADHSGRHGGTEWDAGANFKKALKMGRIEGYTQPMTQVGEVAGAVSQQIDTTYFQSTFESAYEVCGAEVDMGRFLSGEPECMVQSQPVRIARAGRAVRVVIPVTVAHSVPSDLLLRRGAAVIALCDVLQRAKHPLEVWIAISVSSRRGDSREHNILVKVQEANQPLDEGRLCYALAHPTVHRRLAFAVQEGETEEVRRAFGFGCGSYGSCIETDPENLPDQVGNTIMLPAIGYHGGNQWTVPESVAWIESQLANIFED